MSEKCVCSIHYYNHRDQRERAAVGLDGEQSVVGRVEGGGGWKSECGRWVDEGNGRLSNVHVTKEEKDEEDENAI